MAENIIELERLTKTYKAITAVREVSARIGKGEIFGLIGRNGAGKSTLLKMIGGLVYPTEGNIYFFNRTTENNPSLFERMGLLVEQPGLYPQYSAEKNLSLLATAYGLKEKKPQIDKLLKLVGLEEAGKRKVKHFSMGMKQRLGIAIALLGSPDVLILDEPINGLDPQGIADIRQVILDLNKTGLTIIIASHMLEELSKVATQYGILHQGELIEVMSRDELMAKCGERIELEVPAARDVIPLLEQELGLTHYQVLNDRVLHVYDERAEASRIVEVLVKGGILVHSIHKHKQSLEQYFLERTGVGRDTHV
ncbi:ABC transporter ATP-binding protein [Paenibacillus sp. CAU 1782]